MNKPYINKFLGMVLEELDKAEEKHPHFCDAMTPPGFDFDEEEKRWKKWNDESEKHYACDLLSEEIAEAMNSYINGNNALEEFAQCGAVIMRMMEHVQKEIDNGTHPESHEKKV